MWISIKDTLPPINNRVWIYGFAFDKPLLGRLIHDNFGWIIDDVSARTNQIVHFETVSHWAKLNDFWPKPPEGI